MNYAFEIETICEVFQAACEQFDSMLHQLHGDLSTHMEHDQVEALVTKEGRELLRRLLQGHLDLRAKREQRRESVEGADEIVRTRCRNNCEKDVGCQNRRAESG